MLWRTPILMYHSIYAGRPHRVGVDRGMLEQQLRWLQSAGWRGVSVGEHLSRPRGRHICLTFDDGYCNNLTHAVPMLGELGFTATFFVCTHMEGRHLPWHDDDPQPLMGPDEWVQLKEAGHEVGVHGRQHAILSELSAEEVGTELEASKRSIESVVGPVGGFAYPAGRFTRPIVGAVRDLFPYACATRWRGIYPEDRWTLRRIGVNAKDDLDRFRRKTSLWFRVLCDFGW